MRGKHALTLGGLILIAACAGSSADGPPPPVTTTPVTARPPTTATMAPSVDAAGPVPVAAGWQGQAPYQLTFSSFHFEIGTEVMEVNSDGRVVDVFARMETVQVKKHCARPPADDVALCAELRKAGDKEFGRVRRFRATYTLAPAELAEAQALLVAAGFPRLQPLYQDPAVDDGVTHTYQLQTPVGTFTTTAYSGSTASEPPELLPVTRWLRGVHASHGADHAVAPELPAADYAALERRLQRRAMPTPARP